MTWQPLYMGLHATPDGHAGVLTVAGVHLKVRHWRVDPELKTVTAKVEYDGPWAEFDKRLIALVSG